MVELPDPDGPSSATISPGMMSRLTPHRTWMVASPCWKLRFKFLRLTIGSLITQNLYRIGARGLHRRIKRCQEAEHQRQRDNSCHFPWVGARGQSAEEEIGRASCRERVCQYV